MTFFKSIVVGAGVYVGWTFADICFYSIRGNKKVNKIIRKVRNKLNIEGNECKSEVKYSIGFRA